MKDTRDLINEIASMDKVLGDLSLEAKTSSENEQFYAALACLFILVEQSIKLSLNVNEGNFSNLCRKAKDDRILADEEYELVSRIREIRNRVFHENNYMWCRTDSEGKASLFSEEETRRSIFLEYFTPCLNVVLKMLRQSRNPDENKNT